MTIKEKVTKAMPLVGAHVNLKDPIVTEIMGSLGYDYLFMDMEHMAYSVDDVYHHLLASRATGTPLFVRVPVDDLTVTKHVLEMGVDGVIFPMVRDSEHAKALLDNTLFPPYGTRGFGPKGVTRYGIDDEMAYAREGHLSLCRFIMLELASAVEDIERIAALPYLDGCILGPNDLSGSIGRIGEVSSKETVALIERVISVFHAHGKTVGVATFATDKETLARYRDMGLNMISTGADYEYIRQG